MKSFFSGWLCLTFLGLMAGNCFSASSAVQQNEYLDMDISQLMQVTITSVSKKPQPLVDAPAAIHVISRDDIRRSGVTSIPEALRLAPGIQVARISSSKWAISARGINGNFSNKLLVMIDGRTVYTPGFSGTYWDMQNTLLEDIERIEVIRGPGATMWGANAMNGVINIITRSSADTVGGYVSGGAGNEEKLLAGFRYGAKLTESATGRLYLSYNKRDAFTGWDSDQDGYDGWQNISSGFRIDGETGRNSWTFQGDYSKSDEDQAVFPYFTPTPPYLSTHFGSIDATGANLLGRWQRELSSTGRTTFQLYYDYVDRDEVYAAQTYNTFDVDLQYEDLLWEIHNLTLGLGYRNLNMDIRSSYMIGLETASENDNLYSGFIQDVITLQPDTLWLTLGSKWENNEYTGNEVQPTARVMWKPGKTQSLWASVSRAVRTPSLVESSGSLVIGVDPRIPPYPLVYRLQGNPNYQSEKLIAYEAGYRWFPHNSFSLDITPFYNDYDDVMTVDGNGMFVNGLEGESYGVETAVEYMPEEWLKFVLSYSYINLDFKVKDPGYSSETALVNEGSAPEHQFSFRTSIDFLQNFQANIWLRYVSDLDDTTPITAYGTVDDYLELDLNLSYRPSDNVEIVLVGQNLLNSSHLEFISEFFARPVEVERSGYLKINFWF